jgi:hypothetical protein
MSIATTVSFQYNDKDGQFTVKATLYSNGVVRLESVENECGDDCDIEDWTTGEQSVMKGLARAAAERLEDAEDEDHADDERDIQHEEEGWR